MDRIKTICSDKLKDKETGTKIYYTAYILALTAAVLGTTMFSVPNGFYLIVKMMAVALIVVKVMLYDTWSRKEIIIFFLMILITVEAMYTSKNTDILVWMCLIIGAKNVSFDNILRIYLVIEVSIMMLAFIASMLGVIENLQYETDRGIRNSFGIIYTTDFCAHVFFIMLTYFYLKRERLKLNHFIAAGVITVLTYIFCKSRLDTLCMAILIVSMLIIRYSDGRKIYSIGKSYKKEKDYKAWMWFMPAMAVISILLPVVYHLTGSALQGLDKFMSGRLNLGYNGIANMKIGMLGKKVYMTGYGKSTEAVSDYNFIDCSYLNIGICQGIVFLIMVLLIFMYCVHKKRKDKYFIMASILIAINCIIEHHLIDVSYNPYVIVALSWGMFKKLDN